MSMFKKIAVTNRHLCKGNLQEQVERICRECRPDAVILREKDLPLSDYLELAGAIKSICDRNGTELICNNRIAAGQSLNTKSQLSYQNFLALNSRYGCEHTREAERRAGLLSDDHCLEFSREEVWVSVHSPEEAVRAEKLGAAAIIAGHIFATDCKKGIQPRGLDFLRTICASVKIPVFAIGGIDEMNIDQIKEAGASGACLMSRYMNY